jgi:hypothetical protein
MNLYSVIYQVKFEKKTSVLNSWCKPLLDYKKLLYN